MVRKYGSYFEGSISLSYVEYPDPFRWKFITLSVSRVFVKIVFGFGLSPEHFSYIVEIDRISVYYFLSRIAEINFGIRDSVPPPEYFSKV